MILIQEQLSKNRIIIDIDSHGEVGVLQLLLPHQRPSSVACTGPHTAQPQFGVCHPPIAPILPAAIVCQPLSHPMWVLPSFYPLQVCASVTSSTHERKSKTNIAMSKAKLFLRHNAFQ